MQELPILLVTDGVLMPGIKMKIPVRTSTNLAMVENTLLNKIDPGHGMIVVGYRQDNSKKVFSTGTLAKINQIICWSTNNSRIQYTLHLVGICRVEISNVSGNTCQFKRLYNVCNEQMTAKDETEFIDSVKKLMMLIANEGNQSLRQLKDLVASISLSKFDELSDICMSMIPTVPYQEQLEFLAELDVSKRMKMFNDHVKKFIKTKSLSMIDLNGDSSQKLDDNLGIMAEKVAKTRAIVSRPSPMYRKSPSNSGDELLMKLEAANLPEGTVKETVMQEYERYKNLNSSAPEHPVLRSYLEFVAELPWSVSTVDRLDMKEAKNILETDHEGMEDVKKRILEFLAIKKLKNEMKGPILCLVGPPGVGKTSVAKSIANTLGRKYQRIALGGIRDQSDIRGHRRTYVGAMPGRILNALKLAKCNNPVILLDEVDKLGSGIQGDPSAALLEVLDPEQNNNFTDLYLNLPFDLKNVLFIATANDIKTISQPLLDRMEVIEMSSYSNEEKVLIAKNHIIPKQMTQHALSVDYIVFEDDSIPTMIEYTYEAGVRQLERIVGAVCRNVALRVAESINGGNVDADVISTDLKTPVCINSAAVDEILKKKHKRKQQTNVSEIQKCNESGIVFGLAWTPYGGELLVIEAVMSPGSGKTTLTGNLGNVIKESIQVALSVIRSNSKVYDLDVSNLDKLDLHVHLPAGAVGKDGPSAGCAFTLALFSCISGKKVRKDSAVTGEVTLTGKVLPVGGIKEKLLAAYMNNIKRVILPKANEIDVQELTDKIKHLSLVVELDALRLLSFILRIAECAYGEWWTTGMNRPLFFLPFSLSRRSLIVQYSLLLLLLNPIITVFASDLQGCSLDSNLCENDEICLSDGLFGQCYSESQEIIPLVIQQPLNQIQKEILRIQLLRLADDDLNWPDARSQCVLAYFKLTVVYDLDYDPDFCNIRNPANLWALVGRIQSVLSDSDGTLTEEELLNSRLEARSLIENAIADGELVPVSEVVEVPEESPVEVAEPALLIDPESEVAIPVVVVDETDPEEESEDFILEAVPVEAVMNVDEVPLIVEALENETAEVPVKNDLIEAGMGKKEEKTAEKRKNKEPSLSSNEEKQLDEYVHNVLKNKDTNVKLTEQQIGKLAVLVESLQDVLQQNQLPEELSAPEIEEIIPLTSLNNDQQLMLKKDAEEYNNADMGLANTVHKIVKGDFQRVEGNRVYLKMTKDEVTEDELVKLIEFLDKKIALPNNMYFDDFKYENGELSFRIAKFDYLKNNNEKRVDSASGVAQAVYKRRKDIQTLSGVKVAETGIGSGEEAIPVEGSERDWFFIPILGICAFTITTLFSVLAVHLVKNRRRKFASNLPEVIDSLEGGKSVLAYEDLCRQRMSLQETPSIGPAVVSKTSSISSWPDESLIQSCNLDISTGHVILSFLKEHLENPNTIEDQWNSVSGYYNHHAISTIALEPQNVHKNRDRTVVPYDDTLVTTENGYVNATKIHDSDPRHCSYIITQAPMESTVVDYWQMIWEQGVTLLVNLCQMDEVERYWPEEGSQVYGNYEVNLVSEHIWSEDYVVRSFYLKSLKTNETRTVTQFHYLSWKKNQVPASNKSLLEFRRKVNKSYRGRASPVLVHDFNGAGRAGTYCLIDIVANRIGKGVKEINMAASLEHLRDQRPFLVANAEQYKMVFSCVAEEVTCLIKSIQN